MNSVAVLFARRNSVYKSIPGTDVYDIDRNAFTFRGNDPVISHPPCRNWAQLSQLAKYQEFEYEMAHFAIEMVDKNGGILEHPVTSKVFEYCKKGKFVVFPQLWFGHRALKMTKLYLVGIDPCDFYLPYKFDNEVKKPVNYMSTPERERTPPLLAQYLVQLTMEKFFPENLGCHG